MISPTVLVRHTPRTKKRLTVLPRGFPRGFSFFRHDPSRDDVLSPILVRSAVLARTLILTLRSRLCKLAMPWMLFPLLPDRRKKDRQTDDELAPGAWAFTAGLNIAAVHFD